MSQSVFGHAHQPPEHDLGGPIAASDSDSTAESDDVGEVADALVLVRVDPVGVPARHGDVGLEHGDAFEVVIAVEVVLVVRACRDRRQRDRDLPDRA